VGNLFIKIMKKLYTLLLLVIVSISAQSQVVISQVYGGGGNGGAVYSRDFIELFNKGTAAVDMSGWSIQYNSATGTSAWNVNAIPSGAIIQPGKYYLIAFGTAGANGSPLPTPDFDSITIGFLTLSGTNGRVTLANIATALPAGCPAAASAVDIVGYGTGNCFEGTAAVATLSNSTAAIRLNGGCTDNNNNSTDFSVGTPIARNSASASNTCSTLPNLAIVSPLNNASFAPNSTVTVNISVSNFTVANGTGNGHIHYNVDNGAVNMKYDTAAIVLSGLAPGAHTVNMSLVDNSHNPLSPAVNTTLTFTINALNVVSNLAAVRADVLANGAGKYYSISSQPVVTYARLNRNQKYVQDATAAILIDDVPNAIGATFAVGDAINGLKGQTVLFNGLLELVPYTTATVASSGNSVTPQLVSTSTISGNLEAYESELVQINNATFADANGVAAFAASTNYNINDGATFIFRTLFSEANYITTIIPSPVNIVGLVGNSNAVAQVTARNLADISSLSVNQNSIAGLSVYPNPVKNGVFYINTDANAERTVSVFNVLGKQVLNTTTSENAINVSSLTAGVYMVQITEEGKTATKKLVIE
jgi:hypothetical protein